MNWFKYFRLVGDSGKRSRPRSAERSSHRLTFEPLESRLAPAVAVWTGAAIPPPPTGHNTPNWSDSLNWQGFYIPHAGDDVIFPAGLSSADKPPAVVVNNVVFFPQNPNNAWLSAANSIIDPGYAAINPSLTLGNIVIQDDNYHIDGVGITDPLTILGDISYTGTVTLSDLKGLSLIGPFATSEPSTLHIVLGGTGQQQRFNVANANTALEITAPISGNLGILKVGQGILGLAGVGPAGDNSFTGTVEVSQGILAVRSDTALGTTDAGTVVRDGASLAISDGADVNESLEIVGNGFGGIGALVAQRDPIMIFTSGRAPIGGLVLGTWSGGIAMTPSAAIGSAGTLFISREGTPAPLRSISGGGDLTKVGGGTLILTNENTYSGQTLVNQGTLEITHNLALSIGSSTTVSTNARLLLGASLQVDETLFLNGNGFNDPAGNPMGALQQQGAGNASSWLASITLLSDASIGTDLFTTLTLLGQLLSTKPSLSKVGQGTLVVPVDNPDFAANTFVNNGVLHMTTAQALGPATAGGGDGSITVNSTPTASGTLQVEGNFDVQKDLTLNGIGFNSGGALSILDNITWANPIALGSETSIFVNDGSTLTTNAPISGSVDATLEKNGLGTLILPTANTYLGATTLRQGLTIILNNTSLGGDGGEGTRIVDGATLRLGAALTIGDEDLTLTGDGLGGIGALQAITGDNTWSGLVSLISEPGAIPEAKIDVENDGQSPTSLTFTNVVSGNDDLRKTGTGTLRWAGTLANTYTGTTFVDDGILALAKSAGVNALSGPVAVGDGVGASNTDVLRLEAANQIPDVQPVRVNTDGLFDLNYFDETISTLTLNGGAVINGTAAADSSTSSTFRGQIIGTGPLTKFGTGTFTLTVNSPQYTGTMTVADGTLFVNANHGNAAVVVQNGGILGGTGPVGNVTVNAGGTLAPGAGPGLLTAGDVTFAANSSFAVEANGTTAGTGYDQLVAGTVALNGATLVFKPGFAPSLGASFTVIDATSLGGTFAGLPDLATFTAGTRVYQIHYTATSVVITVVNLVPSESLTSTPNPSLPGQSVTFTATVAAGEPGDPVPTGAVQFFDGSTLLGTGNLVNGVVTFAAALSPAGPHTIHAAYSGDANYGATTATLVQPVTVVSTTTLQALQGPILVGTSAGFVARVAQAAGLPVPTGTVKFFDQGSGAVLGVVALDGTGAASLTTTALPAGTRTVLAVYSGDNFYRSSSATATQLVNERAQSLVVTAPPGPFITGSTVTITATALGSSGNLVNFNGPVAVSVTPNNGAAVVAPATPVFVNGQAVFTVTLNAAGTYTVGVTAGGLSAASGPITIQDRHSLVDNLTSTFAVGTGMGGTPAVTVYNASGAPVSTFVPFPPGFNNEVDLSSGGFTGGNRVAVADVTGDGIPDYIVGTGPTITAWVRVFDGKTGQVILDYQPFDNFQGGVFVAAGDIDKDGASEIVITPDQGGGPRVVILEGKTFDRVGNFFGIADPNFRGGARASLGDLNGDGAADLVVSAGFGGGPRISVYDGAALARNQQVHLVPDFFMFEDTLRNGAFVSVGDVNGDGFGDIVGGAGPGGGPRVLVIDGRVTLQQGPSAAIGSPLANFFAGDPNNRDGVPVAAKNLDGDRNADVVAGTGEGGGSSVSAYSGANLLNGGLDPLFQFDALPGSVAGVFVG